MNKKITQTVILAGGRGERLKPLTDYIPKPMAPINGKPFLDYLINSIISTGINQILILLGYKSEMIVSRYRNIQNINIEFSLGNEEDQTGRRVLNAYDQLQDYFLLIYGDNYWPIELDAMWYNYQKTGSMVSTTVFSNQHGTGEYGFENNVVVGQDGQVINYDKKRESHEANGIDIGYFIVGKNSLDPQMLGNLSFEVDILPQLIRKKQLSAYVTNNQYYYITNKKTLNDFEIAALKNNFTPLHQKYFTS